MSDDATLKARREAALGPAYRLFYDKPLHIVRGEGVWLYDADGRRYLDAYNNVACVGHAHRRVVEALYGQAETLNTHTRYLSEPVVDYAERLLVRLPPAIGHVMFACTGSEANDLAVRIARTVTGGTGLIVTANAYHGTTAAIAEASPSLGPDNPIGPAVWVVPAPRSLPYRPPDGPSAALNPPPAPAPGAHDVGLGFANGVIAALEDMRTKGVRPAALLTDTIFSSDGILPGPPGFLADAVQQVRAAGGLFIADEVQAGLGRVGEAFWGFARHGLTPDLVTMGKPMGNGHPIAAVAARRDLVAEFGRKVRYFNTFGGNPVSAAVGLAVLSVIEEEGLARNADIVGGRLASGLQGLNHPLIGEVRQAGLFIGVELAKDGAPAAVEAARIVNILREDAAILISATGPGGNVLKIRPPLVLTAEQADLIVAALGEALGRVG